MNKRRLLIFAGLIIIAIILVKVFDKPTGQSDVVYENEKYGFALIMDNKFNESINIKEEGRIVYFQSKEIALDAQPLPLGVVGRVEAFSKIEYSKEDMLEAGSSYGLKYLGENEAYYLGWAYATDAQVPPGNEELLERFRALEKDFSQVIKTFEAGHVSALPQYKTDTGCYTGLVDNNFFEVKINGIAKDDHIFKVFMISNKVRQKFESLGLQGNEEIKLDYIENEYGQNIVQDIEQLAD